MTLHEVQVNITNPVAEATKAMLLWEEYKKECERIYQSIEDANSKLNGQVAVEVPRSDEDKDPLLLLRAVYSEILDKPDAWGSHQHCTAFVLAKDEICTLRVIDAGYTFQLGEVDAASRYGNLQRWMRPYQGEGTDLQEAINLSIQRSIPRNPPINPEKLRSI